jgi:Flp pilus assembly pilin Flp
MMRCIVCYQQLRARLREELGHDLVEYALFAAIFVLVVTAAVRALSSKAGIVPYSVSQIYNSMMLAK